MAALVAAIHVLIDGRLKDVDARHEPGTTGASLAALGQLYYKARVARLSADLKGRLGQMGRRAASQVSKVRDG
jgi:hypothetical protein